MQRILLFVLLLAGAIAISSMVYLKKKPAVQATGFAVVELFTSEGCSSCPPADKALAGLLEQYKGNVYVLSFHVDYWDYLGWKDAFSSSSYSKRQQQYGNIFHLSSVYTPQAVVNGAAEFTGSDVQKLHTSVNGALAETAAPAITLTAKSSDGKTVTVSFNAAATGVLNVALVQLHAQTNVQRGENSGKMLQHVNVVRDFKTIALKQPDGEVTLALPEGLGVKDCAVIAYTQNGATYKITSAASAVIQQ